MELGPGSGRAGGRVRGKATAVEPVELPWNERLEFLGDAVLGLAVSRRLMERTEEFAEGELSRLRAGLVNEAALAALARRIGLGPFLIMGRGAELGLGRERDSILADAVEALIGAVFRDAGFAAADQAVGRLFGATLSDDGEGALIGLGDADYKTMLQEIVQEELKVTPTYAVVAASGPDHEKRFEVRVMIGERELGRGAGASKKRASQDAARVALGTLDRAPTVPKKAKGKSDQSEEGRKKGQKQDSKPGQKDEVNL